MRCLRGFARTPAGHGCVGTGEIDIEASQRGTTLSVGLKVG
ncbi:hypothetical protein [Synechococcus sp. PROS-7-1]|nr:hypothetical protein [Synechococcus sp. PROS-7-1]